MYRSFVSILTLSLFVVSPFAFVSAQSSSTSTVKYVGGQRRYRGYYGRHSVGTALSARVHAQADLIRSTGEATVDFAAARRIRADARKAETQNAVQRVEAYWNIRRINEEERAKRKIDPETRRRRTNSRTWQKLRLHPDVSASQINSGKALNFLMYRLSATALAWDPSDPPADFDSATLAYLSLPPDILHRLQLQQTTGNSHFVFRADQGEPLKMDWWPYLLRRDEFQRYRETLVSKRQAVIEDAEDGDISVAALEDLETASVDFSTEFLKRFGRMQQLASGTANWMECRDARLFLQSLDLEIARLQRTGDASAFDRNLRFNPDASERHLPALVAFMARNGLKFAPPQPGEEQAYFTVFQLLRDFYLAYDDEDEGIKDPKAKERDA